jgi:serine/threonine-protein kinase RIO1
LLTRDIANLCRFFARYGVRADAQALAGGLWRRVRWRDW